jgi:hypothetical protein
MMMMMKIIITTDKISLEGKFGIFTKKVVVMWTH